MVILLYHRGIIIVFINILNQFLILYFLLILVNILAFLLLLLCLVIFVHLCHSFVVVVVFSFSASS